MINILACCISFLIGSFPTGVLIGQRLGVDPRQVGSGNIGATNVARTMGWRCGLLVLFVDLSKGLLACIIAENMMQACVEYAAFFVTFGHCYSLFLRGSGGKGVATALGALLYIDLTSALLAIGVWLISALTLRIAAVSSLLAVGSTIVVVRLNELAFETQVLTLALFGLICLRHQKNLRELKRRIIAGRSGRK